MYFALTPSMVMAGGSLEVSWSNGWIDAYILCGGDFLISWKPLFYDATVYVTIEVDADLGLFSVSLNMSADVHIWGPDFTGTARLKVCGCEVNVSFGADAGQAPVALDWDTFEGFLPAPSDPDPISQNDCLTIGVSQGLNTTTANAMGNTIYVVDPRQMELAIGSVIPVSKGQYEDSDEGTFYEDIGGIDIAPMNKQDVISTCYHDYHLPH